MNDDTPNYYGIIPAPVRYDNKLPDGAKILFSEITALSNVKGYCYASNGYFAKLYDKHNVTISRLISQLEKRGHIKTITTKDEKGTNRKIYPLNKNAKGVKQKDITRITKTLSGSNKNAKPYNIKVNTKDNIKDKESVNKSTQQAQPKELKAKVQISTKNKTLNLQTKLGERLNEQTNNLKAWTQLKITLHDYSLPKNWSEELKTKALEYWFYLEERKGKSYGTITTIKRQVQAISKHLEKYTCAQIIDSLEDAMFRGNVSYNPKWTAKRKEKEQNYEQQPTNQNRRANRRNGAISQEFSDNIENSLKAFYARTNGDSNGANY